MNLAHEPEDNEEFHISDYLNILKKRKVLIITVLVVVVAIAIVRNYLAVPVYLASASMLVEPDVSASPITGQRAAYADRASQLATFNTHYILIKSKPVLISLLQELKQLNEPPQQVEADGTLPEVGSAGLLHQARQAVATTRHRVETNLRRLLGQADKERSPAETLDAQLAGLRSQIKVDTVPDTRLLTLRVQSTNPENAAQIANLLAEKYIEFDLANRLASENQNLEWLNREVYSLKKRLEDDEQKFFEYKQLHGVFSLSGKQNVINQRIGDLNNEYLDTRNRRQELDAKLNEIEKQIGGSTDFAHVRSLLDNATINTIYNSLTNLELEQNRFAKVFGPKHPKMVQVVSEIDKVKAKLRGELSKEVENLRVQRTVLLNREKQMETNIAEFEQEALDTSGKELNYSMLQRNLDTSQQLYEILVAKIKETNITSGGTSPTIRIVEPATVPLHPFKPNKRRTLNLGILLGLFAGIGLAFLLEYLDQTVRTEEDVQNLVGLPVLAVIPIADQAEQKGYN